MESHHQGHRPFSTFNAGISLGPNTFTAYHYPSRERPRSKFEEVDIHTFSDRLPDDTSRPTRSTTRRLYHEIDVGQNDHSNVQPRSLAKSLFWPTLILVLPITLLATALLALVFAYKVETEPDLFHDPDPTTLQTAAYILVNFSATRLVFVASFLSTVAPVLTSFVMTLWTLPVAEKLRLASLQHDYSQLPTPYQLSLVIGLTMTSYERLWKYFAYVLSPSRSKIPKVVHSAAAMLIFTTCLALTVFGSDIALHFLTSTVDFNQVTTTAGALEQYGRGLSETCLQLDRLENFGLPCSYNYIGTDHDVIGEYNEVFRLQHNASQISELLILEEPSLENGDLVVLAQQSATINLGLDYKASTIGVSSQCQPITTQCDMRADPNNDYHTLFNCTDEFWGVLGAPPNTSETFTKAIDANVPGLAYKPAANIQYAFFNTSLLNQPYNTVGYDAAGMQTLEPLPDDALINPMYFALAGRITFAGESAGSQINNDSEVFINKFPNNGSAVHLYYDFALSCQITSYEVDLIYSDGRAQASSFTPHKNGTFLEIFHGAQFYVTIATGATDLQDYLDQVSLQNTTQAVAKEWGNLYSQKILSTIGGYTSSRTNLAQQQRTSMLVASVPKAALGALLACSLSYTLFGIILCVVAHRASGCEVRDVAAQLGLAGLVSAAFSDKCAPLTSAGTEMSRINFESKPQMQESTRAGVDAKDGGFDFRNWV